MMDFRSRLRDELEGLGVEAGPVVVGVSGGVDSVVLARSLAALGAEIVVAHVDHRLRPDSADDAAFVEALARYLGAPYEVLPVEVAEGNVQAEARTARYEALGALAARVGSGLVAVAHTATDQAETLLLHLVRGAGLRGLAGMAPSRPLATGVHLVRPFLWASRQQVEAEARARGWAWREDSSNATDRYRRNRLRRHVLPLLEAEGGPETVQRIARTAEIVRQSLGEDARRLFAEYAEADGRGGHVLLPPELVGRKDGRRALWRMALGTWGPGAPVRAEVLAAIDALVDREPGGQVVLPGLVVWRERDAIRFDTGEAAEIEDATAPLARSAVALVTETGTLTLDPGADVPDAFGSDRNEEHATAGALGAAVTLRPWRAGDRLRPIGLDGTKLVSDLLTERRVPPSERARQLVLCGEDGRVVWVVGHRLAAHAALRPRDVRAVRLGWTPASIADAGDAG